MYSIFSNIDRHYTDKNRRNGVNQTNIHKLLS